MKKSLSIIVSLFVIISIISALCLSTYAASTKTVSGKFNYSYAAQVLTLVNEERSKYGLKPLTMTESLTEGAMIRAAETTVNFSHTRPNGDSCFTAFNWTSYVGENIAYGQRTPEQVMQGWMNSSGHRANILSSNFTTIGIGCFEYNGTYYWSQAFSGGTGQSGIPSGSKSATVEISLTSGIQSRIISLGDDSATTTTTKATTTERTTSATTTEKQTTTAVATEKESTTQKQTTTAATTTEKQSATQKQTTTAATTTERQCTTKKQATTEKQCTTKKQTSADTATKQQTTAKCANNNGTDIASIISALTSSPCINQILAVDNGFTVCWNNLPCEAQYQIRYCTSSDMKNCKTITVKDCDTAEKTICDLAGNENYYVQLRICGNVNGMNIYSPWSETKCITTK